MPSPFCLDANSFVLWHNSRNDCLVVIRTWFIAKSFLLFSSRIFIHRYRRPRISRVRKTVTSLSCWGRVVIGSLLVYQTIGAGSNPVTSTTVLTVSTRSIGNGQKSCSSFAWEGLERSGPFPILPSNRATFLLYGYRRLPSPYEAVTSVISIW